MLIIGRRAGESIFLGEDVEVKIMDITPSRVKLGIVAPKQLGILRVRSFRPKDRISRRHKWCVARAWSRCCIICAAPSELRPIRNRNQSCKQFFVPAPLPAYNRGKGRIMNVC
jgi:carbon storage regulator CsrA